MYNEQLNYEVFPILFRISNFIVHFEVSRERKYNRMKKVILARPSSLMVNNMKKLMAEIKVTPIPLGSMEELGNLSKAGVVGVVVSTALTSTVKMTYPEVIEYFNREFPEIPIFIASFTNFKRTKIIVESTLEKNGVPLSVVSLNQARQSDHLDFKSTAIVITNEDISESAHIANTKNAIQGIFDLAIGVK